MTTPRTTQECAALHLVRDHAAARAAANPPPGMTDPDSDRHGIAYVEVIGRPLTPFAEWLRRKWAVGHASAPAPYIARYVARVPCVRVAVLATETAGDFDSTMRASMAAANAYADVLEAEGFETYVDALWWF